MVNLTFGANAPKLVKIITDELQRELEVREGAGGREEVMEVTDLADEEKVTTRGTWSLFPSHVFLRFAKV